jgi:ankyrin repeat protein
MLQLLLQKKAEVNAVTNESRMALMEAALWGRFDNVNVLLDHGANPALVCVRNNRQLQAIDFARISGDNQKERSRRARGVNKEDVDSRSRDRKTIESLLLENTPLASDATRLRSFTFTASPIESNIITLFAMFDVPSNKTLGVTWRRQNFPRLPP